MRIAYIITRADVIGGASIHVRDMSQRMINDGHEVCVFLGAGNILTRQLEDHQIPFRQIHALQRSPHPARDLSALVQLIRQLRIWKPELVSTHTSKAGLLGRIACRMLNIPVLYTPHCWSFGDNFPKARLYRRIERVAAFTTTRFVAVSEYERQEGITAKVCSGENCVTIHNGMPESSEPPSIPDRHPPRLIMVARFEEQKDHATLIAALASLRNQPWSLRLVGDGPLQEEIRRQVDASRLGKRVEFMGARDDVAALLSQSDIFVLSTLWESFPRSILEAMRAGLPVVASDIGGCAESVRSGENGYIVPARNPEALAGVLSGLIDSPELRREMGDSSRRIYRERFTFDHMFAKYMDLYQHHINRSA